MGNIIINPVHIQQNVVQLMYGCMPSTQVPQLISHQSSKYLVRKDFRSISFKADDD